MAVDPHDPNRLYVAVSGHPYGPNPERGIYRTTDGGKTFEKVLYKDENIGGGDVKVDPSDPNIVYATLWQAREAPWENGEWSGTNGGVFKSTDGGNTWSQLAGGLPSDIVQANLAIAPSNPKIVFAVVARKSSVEFFRSTDGGATWTAVTGDARARLRIGGGGELPVPALDPENPRYRLRCQRCDLEVHEWRRKLGRLPGCARRRRLPECLDQSATIPRSSSWAAIKAQS